MNTKILMASSAAVLAALGLCATFLPQEILTYAGASAPGFIRLFIQLLGALYLAFAMLNWMSRESVIGGIYSRPLAIGNFLHFTMGALALAKGLTAFYAAGYPMSGTVLATIYAIFAVSFAVVLFRHPASRPQ